MNIEFLDDPESAAFHNGKYRVALYLDIYCRDDPSHLVGKAFRSLVGSSPVYGDIFVGNGMRWDDKDRAVGDCAACRRESPLVPRGRDQRVSRERLERVFAEMLESKRHAGRLQV